MVTYDFGGGLLLCHAPTAVPCPCCAMQLHAFLYPPPRLLLDAVVPLPFGCLCLQGLSWLDHFLRFDLVYCTPTAVARDFLF